MINSRPRLESFSSVRTEKRVIYVYISPQLVIKGEVIVTHFRIWESWPGSSISEEGGYCASLHLGSLSQSPSWTSLVPIALSVVFPLLSSKKDIKFTAARFARRLQYTVSFAFPFLFNKKDIKTSAARFARRLEYTIPFVFPS